MSTKVATTTSPVPTRSAAGPVVPTLAGQAYDALRADILSGVIEPGTKLKMEQLQQRYSLSSSPLREALSRLAAEQIVTVDERRGFRAARVSIADLRDITRFRLVLEVSAFTESIAQGTDEWEAGIIAALHRLEALEKRLPAAARSTDAGWVAAHRSFHTALIAACGSDRLLATCTAMFDQSQRYRAISAAHRGTPRSSRAEHRRLTDAALRRDVAAGAQLLHDHISKTAHQVSAYLAGAAGDVTGDPAGAGPAPLRRQP